MNLKIHYSHLKWTDEEMKIIEAVKKNHSFCSPNYSGTKADLSRIWNNISNETKLSVSTCRRKWSIIMNRYIQNKQFKHTQPMAQTKYMDGRLSFLDQYYGQKTGSPSSAIHDVVVIESDEEVEEAKDFTVLDLEMIDNILLKRGPHEDIEMARREEILSLVSKRIEETLALNLDLSQVNMPLKRVIEPETSASVTEPETCASVISNIPPLDIDKPNVIELDDSSNYDSASQSPQDDDMDVEIASDSLQNEILASPNPSLDNTENTFRIPIASMSIPMPQKPPRKVDDMETVFDIHRRSDTIKFFRELGDYLDRFSEKRQEEIRLKICCVVTEAELEEMD